MPFTEDRKTLIDKYGAYVRSVANTVRKQFSARLDIEDLVAYGTIGLFEASERFDPKVGANFLTFAHYRIKGAIFDGLRKMGTLRGGDQRAAYLGERATAYLSSVSDRDVVGSITMQDDVREIENAVTSLAAIFAASLSGLDYLQLRDEKPDPEEQLAQRQLKARVKVAVERLPENERKLLVAYYYEGKTLEDAGAVIGQSKSWASRLHARAVERIKAFLSEEMEVDGYDPPPLKRPAAPRPSTDPGPAARPGTLKQR